MAIVSSGTAATGSASSIHSGVLQYLQAGKIKVQIQSLSYKIGNDVGTSPLGHSLLTGRTQDGQKLPGFSSHAIFFELARRAFYIIERDAKARN